MIRLQLFNFIPSKSNSLITPSTSEEHLAITATLAHKIWNQHYMPIIGKAQVDYMIDKFQNMKAFKKQIEDGYLYYLISKDDVYCGYLALVPDVPNEKLMISKIYIDADFRGSGLGLELLKFAEDEAVKLDLTVLWLTVNKNNSNSIEWYKKQGFRIVKPVQFDIGNGFIMDDFIMEKSLS